MGIGRDVKRLGRVHRWLLGAPLEADGFLVEVEHLLEDEILELSL